MERLSANAPSPPLEGGDWGFADSPSQLTDEELAEIQGRDHALDPDAAAVFLHLQPSLEPFVNAVTDRHRLIAALRASRASRAAAITAEEPPPGRPSIESLLHGTEFDGMFRPDLRVSPLAEEELDAISAEASTTGIVTGHDALLLIAEIERLRGQHHA